MNVASISKTAMSSLIYEVLDMGTGILDAECEFASSGAGINTRFYWCA
jgi:N-methylhydantoinase B